MSRLYPNRPIVGIGIIVLREDAVLLARRGKPPGEGQWSLPGGGQKLGETAEAAARRELHEETGLDVGELVLAAHVDSIHHDAAGNIAYHYTILDFAALWISGTPRAGSDVLEVTWADFSGLAPYALSADALRVVSIARSLLLIEGDRPAL
jgi:ADP-ribose pyrophosphatase YjhB (NUDIX family)